HADSLEFQTYTSQDGLASDYVNSITFGAGNAVWIGTPGGVTNIQDKYWVTYTSAHGLGNTAVSGSAVGPDGKVYLATNGGGLTLFDAARKTYNLSNSGIPGNYLTSIAVDRQNHVWVGTFGAGVGRLDGDQWSKHSLPNNYINALALDASGNPWVATNDGAFFFDGQTWTRFSQATGLPSSRVYAVAPAPGGQVWFGTDNGATLYDGRRYKIYKQTDGLADNSVRAIAVDTQNRVWLGTQNGLSLFDGGKWKTYTRADGLAGDEITTLALDAQKNVWVGTSHGLSIFGSTTLPRAAALPVVLVHGWHGPDSDRFEDSEFRFLKNYMERDGITPFYASGILPNRTLFQNAATLRDVIADAKAKTGAPRVDVIAFSMGGLNTRALLESTFYQNDVRRAIILGTPEAGVQLWYPLLTREIEDRPNEPSTIELTPEYADLFNRTHTPRATVPYDLLVGDARNQPGLDLLKLFPPSDGLIDQYSAHALVGPLVRRVVDTDVHAWNPAPLPINVTSYLYPGQTYDRFLRNALRDPDSRPIGFAAPPVAPVAPRNITPMNVDTLRAGESVTRTLTIDAARSVRFFARWTTGDITVTLRAPDGARYTPDDFHQATYLKADIGSFIGYAIPRAQTGNWTMSVTRNDKGSEPDTVTTFADLDADLKMNAATDKLWYRTGQPVIITATLSNRAAGVDVRAKIEWLGDGTSPRGASTEVKLLSEGDPGNYGETLTDLTRGGYYLVRITARSAGFTRERQVIFAVSPNTAQFAGPAAPSSVQARVEGAPGNYTALVIDAPVTVKRAGPFALAATLRSAKGDVVLSLTAPVTLAQDARMATIAIPGRDLHARGIDGPFTIDLTLMDASWAAVQLDQVTKAVTTDAYRAVDFSP
ncbi:MAG TPA: two-component regulator propeller domain-containing protein, partial [Anaerolineae bacterium]